MIVGRARRDLARVRLGDVDAGMSQLDAAVAAATAGDVDDVMWMGKICCWLINACPRTHDLGRAADWCQRVERSANGGPGAPVRRLPHGSTRRPARRRSALDAPVDPGGRCWPGWRARGGRAGSTR